MRKQGIEYGYSRGSVSGSIISISFTYYEVDSIEHKLNFERFMNQRKGEFSRC